MYSIHLLSNSEGISIYKDEATYILGKSEKDDDFASTVNFNYSQHSWNVGSSFSGKWWFLIQDTISGKLKLTRDKLSYTSLFFTFIDLNLFISENINDILEIKKFEINLKEIASFMLLNMEEEDSSTFFEGVFKIPAGYQMIYENGNFEIARYWFPENTTKLKYFNKDNYHEQFYDIFNNAVVSSLNGYNSVATTLSGGLDSSSVTCLAAKNLEKKGESIFSFTHIPRFVNNYRDRSTVFGNEEEHVKLILKQYKNIKAEFVLSQDISPIQGLLKLVDITGGLIHGAANAYWLYNIFSKVSNAGHQVLLMGENGNATISYLGDRLGLNWSNNFYKNNFRALCIDKIYAPLNRLRQDLNSNNFDVGFHFLSYAAFEDLDLKNSYITKYYRNREKKKDPTNYSKNLILDNSRKFRMPFGGQVGNYFGFIMADPTANEELVEFSYSLPNEVNFGENGMDKNIVRNIMNGILPDKVRLEKRTGQQSADIAMKVLQTEHEVTTMLDTISKNRTFQYLFDLNKLNMYWNAFKLGKPEEMSINDLNSFLKVIMAGILICKFQK